MGITQTEKDFQRSIKQLASATGWLIYHTYDSRRSQPGFPDLAMVRDGKLVFAELKVGSNHPTTAQKKWLRALGKCEGVGAYLWRPEDWNEIEEVLKKRPLT